MTLPITLPNDLSLSESELKMHLAAHLFEKGLVSSGQAALIAGIAKKDFVIQLGQYGVSLFSQNEEELSQDWKNA